MTPLGRGRQNAQDGLGYPAVLSEATETMAEKAITNGGTMPKKKTAAKTTSAVKAAFDGSKTDFILKYANLKPLQVAAKAKEAGLDISAGYVSSVRSKNKTKKGVGGKRARGASPGSATVRGGAEAEFRRAARAITLDRAQEILNEIAAAYGA